MDEFEMEGFGVSGNYISWYETGSKKESFYYRDDVPEGEWYYYKEDEKVEKVETYKGGKLIKTVKY
jgi:antitoxin component YwqK of YwqJK toxin-antitoxin module